MNLDEIAKYIELNFEVPVVIESINSKKIRLKDNVTGYTLIISILNKFGYLKIEAGYSISSNPIVTITFGEIESIELLFNIYHRDEYIKHIMKLSEGI